MRDPVLSYYFKRCEGNALLPKSKVVKQYAPVLKKCRFFKKILPHILGLIRQLLS